MCTSVVLLRRFAVALITVALTFFARAADADDGSSHARLLSVHGTINAVTARYVERELGRAAAEEAPLVIVRLDTPGGLDSSMREITQAVLASRVPVVAYVAPSGARAASAGMFVTPRCRRRRDGARNGDRSGPSGDAWCQRFRSQTARS